MKVKYTKKVNDTETIIEVEFEELNEKSIDLMGLLQFPIREQIARVKKNIKRDGVYDE